MSVTTTVATAVVTRWLTKAPITLRLRQKSKSGMRAKGMPKESTTWLITSERLGLTPMARIVSAGTMVMRRRRNSGIRRLMKPCMTTCPAIVPTEELELLEGLVDVAHAGETVGVEEGCSRDEHAGVDGPRYGHGDHHVDPLEAEDLLLLLVGPALYPPLRQGRVQVDDVRHDRGPEDPAGDQHALGARELRSEEPGEDALRRGPGIEHLEGEAQDDHPNQR